MLRMNQNNSVAGAKNYFRTSDYYTEGQEREGIWRGNGAARLGLSGPIAKEAWEALCDNRNPATGQTLTPRRKSERRVGYDFNFHVPKSVSVLYGITGDERIVEAFRDSVNDTMLEMEKEMKTRVRKGGKNEERTTGEMIWGEYVHFTSRPIDGIPDPHLHAHCFVLNTTFDKMENRWKAGSFAELKRDAPYFEAKFHSRMADRMAGLGLLVERTKQSWEIGGIGEKTLKRFSRRTALIEDLAKSKGIDDPREKSELGAKTRERKQKHLSMAELRQEWRSRLGDEERYDIARAAKNIGGARLAVDSRGAERAAKLGVDHCYERRSVVPERTLLAEAIRRGVGVATADAVEAAVREQDIIIGEKEGRRLATTRRVLEEEQRMIDFARTGRGACAPLGHGTHVFSRDWLNEGQRRAVEHVLQSRDRVILIRGVAGTGKTTMMSEAVEAIKASGKEVFTFAPSADASRGVLRESGFKDADTVAILLKDTKLHEKMRGQVIWIDEASLLGSRPMRDVFDLADRLEARIILSGDRRQHGSVDRGAALRLLETEAGLIPAEIKEIQRQKGAYKKAVQALSEGRTERGFQQLDALGWIKEAPDAERYKLLASDYVAAIKAGKSALVVSPTHREGEWVTDQIRTELRRERKLGLEQRSFRALHNANLTTAQRADSINFASGDVLVFHQNARGFGKGDRVVAGDRPLPLEQSDRFTVFKPAVLPLSCGDVIRVTHNGKTADGQHRLNNGALFTVKSFTDKGDIRLTNGWIIDKDFGHLAHGYAVTSQASQGKTVDRVLIGISSASFAATSREGFYVAASRGREFARVYTDSRSALLEAVGQTDDRLSATEFMSGREHGDAVRRIERQKQAARETRVPAREKEGVSYER
jgi:conjugative relaxase-like TrwC/TraI family protein